VKALPPDNSRDIDITAGTEAAGVRFDQFLAGRLPGCSRNIAGRMIRLGHIKINNAIKKPGHRLQPGERITGVGPAADTGGPCELLPECLDIDIVYQDSSIIVINKPPGLVVHPAPGHSSGTLAHALRYHFPEISDAGPPGRSGIVHRIDKDTSGILVVAKTPDAFTHLSSLFKSRKIQKSYVGFVYGSPLEASGRILSSISRHKKDRKKMAVSGDPAMGKPADTAWEVVERFHGVSLLRITIKTGRTHQIRVHCQAMGHPLVGDTTYGYKKPLRAFRFSQEMAALLKTINRQLLHASRITFPHPETGSEISFEAPLPNDMAMFHASLNRLLKNYCA
jgi:23S rRNA pseudouridine1911/1915/1917 synthase